MAYKSVKANWPFFVEMGDTFLTTSVNSVATSTTFFVSNMGSQYTSYEPYTPFTNGIFTAPVKGLYYFKIILCFTNDAINSQTGTWGISITKSGTGTVRNRFLSDNPESRTTYALSYTNQFSTIVQLDVGDTVKMYATGLTTDLESSLYSYFMGNMIAAFN